jgi:hypothetical protein
LGCRLLCVVLADVGDALVQPCNSPFCLVAAVTALDATAQAATL